MLYCDDIFYLQKHLISIKGDCQIMRRQKFSSIMKYGSLERMLKKYMVKKVPHKIPVMTTNMALI